MFSHPPPPEMDAERTSYPRRIYKAARVGNWEAAKEIFDRYEEAKTSRINPGGCTALHVAAFYDQFEFVEKLVSLLSPEELQIRTLDGDTALHFASLGASVKVAKAMVDKNPSLPQSKNAYDATPCYFAAKWRNPPKNKDMLKYLCSVTDKELLCSAPSALDLVRAIIDSGSYDIGLELLEFKPELAVTTDPSGLSVLHFLSTKPSAFASGSKLSLWERLIYPWMNNVSARQKRLSEAQKLVNFIFEKLENKSDSDLALFFFPPGDPSILHSAIEHGVFELLEECLNHFPHFVEIRSREGKHLLLAAIENRRMRIFNHIRSFLGEGSGALAGTVVAGNNNILHLAAKLAPWRKLHFVPHPLLEIQREMLWFKTVEALVSDKQRAQKNDENETPQQLFFKEHEAQFSSAKNCMKDTSNACMLVAALVTTVAFTAMFKVPGGNDNNSGMPILSKNSLLKQFHESNVVSMIFSTLSLLMFLSVQTSRYTKEYLLESLPMCLFMGLYFLFFAVVTMMINFVIVLRMSAVARVAWFCIFLACIPIICSHGFFYPFLFQTFVVLSNRRAGRDPKTLRWLESLE